MISIDSAGISDIPDICVIEQACFSRPWSEKSICELLGNENSLVIVARGGAGCVGYIGARVIDDECEIMNIGVLPAWRRQGVASALLARLISEATLRRALFVSLEVRASNKEALALYGKFGFRTAGRRKNYYSAPVEDAVILRVEIRPVL